MSSLRRGYTYYRFGFSRTIVGISEIFQTSRVVTGRRCCALHEGCFLTAVYQTDAIASAAAMAGQQADYCLILM